MAKSSKHSYDSELTIVVSNFPEDVGEDELTIHFQKEKNGGGDVDEVVVDENIAFVIFDLPEVATSVLKHSEQVINERKVEVQSYESWLANKKKKDRPPASSSKDNRKDSPANHTESENATIYVSGIKDSSTTDAISFFFENKKRTGGGELCEGKKGFKRLSPTVARLTFVSSKDAAGVLQKANETPLELEGNLLTVSRELIPTHDQSILFAKNLNPKTSKETLKNFVESTKNADVFNVVLGKDGKAIVILKIPIDADEDNSEKENTEMKLNGSIISLEFAPLTKGIKISNIPQDSSPDDIKFKFANPKIGGDKVTDIMLDRNNGVASVYFEKSSVVSDLVKKKHTFSDVPLTVIPYYDDFEEVQEKKTKTSDYSGDYSIDPLVMDYIMNTQEIDKRFDFKSMKFDKQTSRIHFTKQFDDPKHATEFKNKFQAFLHSFVKEEVRIAKALFGKVKEAIESKRDEFEAVKIDFNSRDSRVFFVGEKPDIAQTKQLVETMVDRFTDEAQKESTDLPIEDKNKLKFLNFIGYFEKLMTEFPEVRIHGSDGVSGKVSLLGTAAKTKDVQLRIYQDMVKISEISVKTSVRQTDFLQRTQCKIVNDELKNDDAMLLLIKVEGAVGAKALQAKIMTLKRLDDTEKKRLLKVVDTKTSEKCITVHEETVSFLSKSSKLQEFKKEQYEKHQVLIDLDLAEPRNIWIVCEKSKIDNAELELESLTDEKRIECSKFTPMDPIKLRFLREHCWGKIKEKERSYKAEGVVVQDIDTNSFEIKGTKAGRTDMIMFLERQAGNVHFKKYPLNEPGMKKQMSLDTTNAIISEVEKNHKCVIQKGIPPDEMEKKSEASTFVADGGGAAGTSGASTMNLPYNSMSFVNDKEVKLASGQRITIVVGDLAQQTVDVIVNTTNDKVDLNANPCGKALLKVAGQGLVNECKKIGSLQAGEMASTGPANLKCKRVFHVRSSAWDSGKGTPILRQIIQKCFDQLEKDKLTSIAIPAIGTGNLHFPRPEVAKVFFEEATTFLAAHPQSAIDDVRFVAYGKDQATVDAFLGAVQEIKSMILSPASKTTPVAATGPVPVPLPRKNVVPTPSHHTGLGNVTTSERPDGSLELILGGSNITVQIVCDDISKETTDLIMHVTSEDFSFNGGVGKALVKAGGKTIEQECKGLGQPALFSTQYTKAGDLSVSQIAHVIGTGKPSYADLKKCLENFFDGISQKNIAKVSFSAIGAGAMGYSECQSADLIFDNLFRIAQSKNPALSLVRIVIFEKAKFMKFKDAAKAYVANGGPTSSTSTSKRSSYVPKFSVFRPKKQPAKTIEADGDISIKIYCDDRGRIEKAWLELKKKIVDSIKEQDMSDDVIKKFTDRDLEKIRKLERDFDVQIKVDQSKGNVKIKGHIADISYIQEEIRKILKDITENEPKVPDYWDSSLTEGVHKIQLLSGTQEYTNIETEFHKTAANQIVQIDRIQNRKNYELYNVKRQAMSKKYGSNFSGKELRLFHGTSYDNVEKINFGGLNRSFAGKNATHFGRGVYFARDASYSAQHTYSPSDSQGLRYMYYARVLVGEYTNGNASMIVPPSKNSSDPNETYDCVVNNVADPVIYVMFQDYEYYTEYLITFK